MGISSSASYDCNTKALDTKCFEFIEIPLFLMAANAHYIESLASGFSTWG